MDNFLTEMQAELLSAKGIDASDLRIKSMAPGSVHIDRALSNLSVLITNREMIADAAMPRLKVAKPSDKYFKWDADSMFETQAAALVGPESTPDRIRAKISTDTYSCLDYGLMDFVSYKEEAVADAPLQPRAMAARLVANRLLLAKERRVAAVVFGSGNYGSNTAALAGASQWDQSTSDPVQDIENAIEASLVRPNTLVLGVEVWIKLRNHPRLKELILSRASSLNGATPLRIESSTLADAFGLDRVLIGRAKHISSREGATSASAYIWGKSAALIRVAEMPDMRETDAFGYQFEFQPFETQVVEDRLRGLAGGVFIKTSHSVAEEVVAGSNAGYLYTTVVA